MIKQSSKKFRYFAIGPRGLCFEIVNFCRTEAGLTSKWGRISPAVYWWHQNQSRYIVWRCATSRGVAKKLADHSPTHTQSHIWRQLKWTLGTQISTKRSKISRRREKYKMFVRRLRKRTLKYRWINEKVLDILMPPIFTKVLSWIDSIPKCEVNVVHTQ